MIRIKYLKSVNGGFPETDTLYVDNNIVFSNMGIFTHDAHTGKRVYLETSKILAMTVAWTVEDLRTHSDIYNKYLEVLLEVSENEAKC